MFNELANLSFNPNGILGPGFSFSVDLFRLLYMGLIILSWALSLMFTPRYLKPYRNKTRYYVFTIVTLIGTLGVFASGDLFTLFCFFELMSFASYVWVAQDERKESLKAADTYLYVAVIGGLFLLMGIVLIYYATGTLNINELSNAYMHNLDKKEYIIASAICMFIGFAAKAGAYPVHIWLPKAHPVAPAPASALLSGVLTKSGIFGIMIVGFYVMRHVKPFGIFVLVIGLITMVLGAVLAVFSVDLKRTLACSSMSQIGFIVTGIGANIIPMVSKNGDLYTGDSMALLDGTILHMMNHTLVKMAVFLVAGVVYQNTHKLNLNEIRGFGRKKPFLATGFLLGALSLSGVPGFLGYLSKTLLHEGLIEPGFGSFTGLIEWTFLISGGFTLCYMTKLFVALFMEKGATEYDNKNYMSFVQRIAVLIPGILLLISGISLIAIMNGHASTLSLLLEKAGFGELHHISFLSFEILKGAFISIGIGVVLYFFLVRLVLMDDEYKNLWPEWLDLEELIYRPLITRILPLILGFFARALDQCMDAFIILLRKTLFRDKPISEARLEGNALTHVVGYAVDYRRAMKEEKDYVPYDYEKKLNIKWMELQENVKIAKRSMSFGLILACIGMFAMLSFILVNMFL